MVSRLKLLIPLLLDRRFTPQAVIALGFKKPTVYKWNGKVKVAQEEIEKLLEARLCQKNSQLQSVSSEPSQAL